MRLHAGQEGYMLKRRISGVPCPVCLDHQTREVRDPACPVCWGTGWECGYFFPMSCVWADMDPKTYHTKKTDDRFYVHSVQNVLEVKGVPLVADVELRLAPASDPIYDLPIPQQLAAIGGGS